MVMAQSLFKALRRRDPEAAIDVLAPGWSLPLLARMPEVAEGIEQPLGHGALGLGTRRRMGRRLAGRGYVQAILLPNSWKSALIPFWAGIPRRTGWRGEMRYGLLNDVRRLDKARLPMTVQRFVALAVDAAAPLPAIEPPALVVAEEAVAAALGRLGLERPGVPLLALCPGAEYGPAKRWPADAYGRLAAGRVARGWAVWLFGAEKDGPVCRAVNEASGGVCRDLAGRTRLEEAVDLMSLADAVVSNDSGLMHVAAALQRPLVALYGSSDPGFTPPLNPQAQIVSHGLSCSPCFERVCPLGHLDCLRGIGVDEVEQALQAVAA